MAEGNGIRARLQYIDRELEKLWDTRASKESIRNVEDDVRDLKESMKEVRDGFRQLQISILVACVVWALGSAGFIIGVITLTGG